MTVTLPFCVYYILLASPFFLIHWKSTFCLHFFPCIPCLCPTGKFPFPETLLRSLVLIHSLSRSLSVSLSLVSEVSTLDFHDNLLSYLVLTSLLGLLRGLVLYSPTKYWDSILPFLHTLPEVMYVLIPTYMPVTLKSTLQPTPSLLSFQFSHLIGC